MGHKHDVRIEGETYWTLPFADVARLDLQADAFSIVVEAIGPSETPCIEMRKANRAPTVKVERDGETVRVSIRHDSGIPFLDWIPWSAGSRLIVRVPQHLHARIYTGAGTIRATDLVGGDLELKTDAGTIEASRLRGNIRLFTSAGTIDGDDLAGTFDVKTDAGTVKLSIASLDPGVHRVHTSAGTVRVDLGRDVHARIEASSSFGSSRVNFPSLPNAAAVLSVTSDAGTVRVRGSEHVIAPPPTRAPHPSERGTPYRQNEHSEAIRAVVSPLVVAEEDANEELERVLQMVADGKLTPLDAGEILRALGHG
ncbi:MAG: DUF4097 family beta strand repeat-containing protein [Polyangiaceae bacterium]